MPSTRELEVGSCYLGVVVGKGLSSQERAPCLVRARSVEKCGARDLDPRYRLVATRSRRACHGNPMPGSVKQLQPSGPPSCEKCGPVRVSFAPDEERIRVGSTVT